MDQTEPESTDPEAVQNTLVASFTKFESTFRKRFPLIWIATLAAPVVVSLVLLGVLGATYGWGYSGKLVSHALLTFFVFGRFIILSGADTAANGVHKVLLSPQELFGLVTYLDFMTALFVTFHMGFLFRLPWLGPKIATLVWDGKFVMESQPWIKRVAFLGLVSFVIFPTSTTGSIGGSIFGRLLGLTRWATVAGVLVGSILGNGIMYVMSKQLNNYISKDDLWLKIAGGVLVIALCVAMEWRYRQVKKKYLIKEGIEESGEDSS